MVDLSVGWSRVTDFRYINKPEQLHKTQKPRAFVAYYDTRPRKEASLFYSFGWSPQAAAVFRDLFKQQWS